MNDNHNRIYAIAFCGLCREYIQLINEKTASLDAERKISRHAGIKHDNSKANMGWTKVEQEMVEIRRRPGYSEGNL